MKKKLLNTLSKFHAKNVYAYGFINVSVYSV